MTVFFLYFLFATYDNWSWVFLSGFDNFGLPPWMKSAGRAGPVSVCSAMALEVPAHTWQVVGAQHTHAH